MGFKQQKTFVEVWSKVINIPDFVNMTMSGQVTAQYKGV